MSPDSEAFPLRLGSIAGGLISGDARLHPGGGRMRQAGVGLATVSLEVYAGQDVYRREFELIRSLRPPANRIPKLGRPARRWPAVVPSEPSNRPSKVPASAVLRHVLGYETPK